MTDDIKISKTYDGIVYRCKGLLHRVDGPAIERLDGTKEWYHNNVRHRVDGPAIERPDGTKEWFINDKRHREGAPAVEYLDGDQIWFMNGMHHRTDGPAVILKGEEKLCINCRTHTETKTISWYQNDKFHRINGPAVIHPNGYQYWRKDGKEWPKGESIYHATETAIALAPLQLPAYVLLWILEWMHPPISKLNQPRLVEMLQRIRDYHSRKN